MAWLTGWSYRKAITVNGTTAQTDYQMPLTVRNGEPFAVDGWGVCWQTTSEPVAWHYVGTYDRTYIVYQGPKTTGNGDIYITYYDHDTHLWATPVKIEVSEGDGLGYDGTPSLAITSDGHIVVIHGGNEGNIYTNRSTNAEDISSWETHVTISTAGWYPTLVQIANGNIYAIYVKNSLSLAQYAYKVSTNGGVSFGSEVVFIDLTATGQIFGSWTHDAVNDRIIGQVIIQDSSFITQGRYCVILEPDDGKVYDIAGNSFTVPLTQANADNASYKFKIHGAETLLECSTGGLGLDANGIPYLSFANSVSGTWHVKFTYWTGSDWSESEISSNSGDEYIGSALDVKSSSNIEAYLNDENNNMSQYHFNGSSWSKVGILVNHLYEPTQEAGISPCVPMNYHADIQIVFTSYNTVTFDNLRLYAYGSSGLLPSTATNILSIPYGMIQDDFDDIRFTDSGGSTLLDYWVETIATRDNEKVWIEIPTIPASPDTVTIYIYYSNPSATAQFATPLLAGEATFPFFDDFGDASIDTNKWFHWLDNGSESESGGIFALVGAAGYNYWGAKTKFGTNYAYRGLVKISAETLSDTNIFGFDERSATGLPAPNDLAVFIVTAVEKLYYTQNHVATTSHSRSDVLTSYSTVEIQRNSSTSVKFLIGDVLKDTITTTLPTTACGLALWSPIAVTISWDWVLVRKYTATEPAFSSAGSEETEPTGQPTMRRWGGSILPIGAQRIGKGW